MRVFPSWLTPHRAVLLGLTALAACAFVVAATDAAFVARPAELAASLLVALAASAAVGAACAAAVRVPPGADSWAITALILFFVLPSGTDSASLTTIAVGAGAAAASKYVLAWRRRLIVNPAVAGAVVCYALAYAGVGAIRYPSWWIAADSLLWPMIVIGAAVVTAIGRWPLVLTFLAASVLTLGVVHGTDLDFSMWLVSTPMFFVAAVMLPEPLTCPATAVPRTVYAAGVGILMYCGLSLEVTSSYFLEFVPEVALLIGCVFAFLVRLAGGSARRSVMTAGPTTAIADRTWLTRFPDAGPARFAPGQWAALSAPSWSTPLWGRTRRVFSYVNAPGSAGAEFAFTAGDPVSAFKEGLIDGRTRRVYLDDRGGDFVLPGDAAFTGGAGLPGDRNRPLVLIASGIGITPIVSMLRAAAPATLAACTVIHVVRSGGRAAFGDDLAAARDGGALVAVLESATLADGLDRQALAELLGGEKGAHYYVSGNPDFVRTTSAAVRRHDPATRWNPRRLNRDSFAGY